MITTQMKAMFIGDSPERKKVLTAIDEAFNDHDAWTVTLLVRTKLVLLSDEDLQQITQRLLATFAPDSHKDTELWQGCYNLYKTQGELSQLSKKQQQDQQSRLQILKAQITCYSKQVLGFINQSE
jgi:hypothetical protein